MTDASPSPGTPAPSYDRFAPLAPDYEVVLCDVWGVLHDGVTAHEGAVDALTRFREGGGAVVLVSNAPRPSEWVATSLDEKGVPRTAWDAIVTSGDVARHMVAERGLWAAHHIGPARDLPLLGDERIARVSPGEAAIVVATGLFDEDTENPEDYDDTLAELKRRGLPLVCANPDVVVMVGERQLWCAGAIADRYEAMGGETLWAGKPYGAIYDAALNLAGAILGRDVPRKKVVAIGDAVRTDLAGATAAGIDCVFIADGIHGDELGRGAPDPEKLAALFAEHSHEPIAVMPKLVW